MTISLSRGFLLATASGMTALAGIGFAGPAYAADNAPVVEESAEDIVVTARRRLETSIEVPVALTAISGDQLRDSGIIELRDIMALVPNAVIQDNSENFNIQVNIRGMRSVDVQAEPNVGIYRNGLYVGGHRANLGALVDIDRVEILRGPQGGLYGRSSVGGTVDIVYAMPKPEFGGYAKASYGTYNHTEIEGAVNIPVGEKVALRLTGWSFNQTRAETYNETLDEYVGAFSDRGLRGSLSVDLSDRLNVLWTAEYTSADGPSLRTFAPDGILNNGVRSRPETIDLVRRDTKSESKKTQLYLAQVINWDTDIGKLTLNASYRDYDYSAIQDVDHTDLGPEDTPTTRQTDMLRNEGTDDYFIEAIWSSPTDKPFTWMAGASYFKETFDFARILPVRLNTPFGIRTFEIGFPKIGTSVGTETLSAFATIGYDVTPRLSLEGSLRYSEDKKTLRFMQGLLPSSPPDDAFDTYVRTTFGAAYPNLNINSRSKFTNWSPSLSVRYRANDDLTVYASYSTGFRPGSFNLTPTTPETIPYGQETATNYELGVKGRFFDRRLDLNLAAYFMRQGDLLITQQALVGGVQRSYLANAGSANTYGIEAEATFRPNSWLSATVAVGYLDPKFDNAKSPGIDLSGKLIPYTRRWTMNARFDAQYPISDDLDLVSTAAVRHESGGVLGDYYVNHDYEQLTKIDLSAGFKYKDTRVTAYVRNLLDENVPGFWYYNGSVSASQGRTVGIDITQKF